MFLKSTSPLDFATGLQARLAEAEEDKAKMQQRADSLAARLKEAEQAASTARAEAHRNMDSLSQLDQDMRATEATLASVQDQLQQALQVWPATAAQFTLSVAALSAAAVEQSRASNARLIYETASASATFLLDVCC